MSCSPKLRPGQAEPASPALEKGPLGGNWKRGLGRDEGCAGTDEARVVQSV